MSKTYIPAYLRKLIKSLANNLCEYCLFPDDLSHQPFWIDHIIPEAKDGETVLENLANSCPRCNSAKHAKTFGIDPLTQKEISLFNPRKDSWKKHFEFSEDYLTIIGKTPCGRATVETLKMNEQRNQNIRGALVFLGKFPPEGF